MMELIGKHFEYAASLEQAGRVKPTLKYKPIEGLTIEPGRRATIQLVGEHPDPWIMSDEVIHTSMVLKYDEAIGTIETRNTIYELDKTQDYE